MKLVVGLVGALLFPTLLGASLNQTSDRTKVVFIGIDGMGVHNAWPASGRYIPQLSHLEAMRSQSLHTVKAKIDHRNWSGPNWMGMLSGMDSDKHGVYTNNCERGHGHPTIFDTIKRQKPEMHTAIFSRWQSILCYPEAGSVSFPKKTNGTDHTMEASLRYFREEQPDFMFVYLGFVDGAGHGHGSDSREYKEALEKADRFVGSFASLIESMNLSESTYLIVTSDHGHHPSRKKHSSKLHPVPFLIQGPGITATEIQQSVWNRQVTPLVAYLLGIEPEDEWMSTASPFAELIED